MLISYCFLHGLSNSSISFLKDVLWDKNIASLLFQHTLALLRVCYERCVHNPFLTRVILPIRISIDLLNTFSEKEMTPDLRAFI